MTAAEMTTLRIFSDHFALFMKENRDSHEDIKRTLHETRTELRDDVLQKFEAVLVRVEKIELHCEERRVAGEVNMAASEARAVAAASAPTEGVRAVHWIGRVSWRALTIVALLMGALLYLITILEHVHIM